MPAIAYKDINFRQSSITAIDNINTVLDEYASQGFDLTSRQVYYQFVAHKLFPEDRKWRRVSASKWVKDPNGTFNAEPNYKWLCKLISDGRLAGYIDWHRIEDRTRALSRLPTWRSPAEIMEGAAAGFRNNLWADQDYYVEAWVEKEALAGVVERPSVEHRIPFFCCRGYTSSSAFWQAAQRIGDKLAQGYNVKILHLGDHDPSGVDMTRDIVDRMENFLWVDRGDLVENFSLDRLALNINQVREYNPPPDPAKLDDSRAKKYIREYGSSAWELDALSPTIINDLITEAIEDIRDPDLWSDALEVEQEHRRKLDVVVERWDELTEDL